DSYLAQTDPQQRYKDARRTAEEVAAVVNDPAFAQLPKRKQDELRGYLEDLRTYAAKQDQLARVPDPADVRDQEQLDAVKKSLDELTAAPSFRREWWDTELGRRAKEQLADVQALDAAVYDVRRRYRQLAEDGQEVLRNKNAADLPGRARKVLEREKKLPDPKKDLRTKLPNAAHVTYATVFAFRDVVEARRAWEQVRGRLAPLAEL